MPENISDQSTPLPVPPSSLGDITELEDGSAIVEDSSDAVEFSPEDFGANLAESLDQFQLNTIASDLLELIEKDKVAREERDKQQEEGIRRTGLGNDAPGGATFDGASKIVHPVLAEGCVDFSARAIKELFPSNGPVRTKITGEATEALLKKAKSKRDFLNFYLTERMPEYRAEKETLLTQLPLGGSQYEKYWFDGKRVRMEFVPIDKVYLPYSANSFYTAQRITYARDVTEEDVRGDVASGFYKDVFGPSDSLPEESASQVATNKVEGKQDSGYNEDGIRIIYEVACVWDVEDDGPKPYVIHIDEPTGKIAAIYRNWKESDANEDRLDWWVEDKFIPWRGAYGIGFPHLIGGMSAALTGALRALLDSAHINNAPSAIKLKGGRTSGQNVTMEVTSVTEIEAPAGVDDVRKIMMPVPFNPPSAVLFQLLDWLTAQAKGVVATAEERIADAGNNMPVGTTLALIEQGSQVFSSIHARLHDAQRRALKIICRLIADYPDHAMADMARFDLVPADFLQSDDVEPVSDPNIFSETQRFAQIQAVMQLASADVQDPTIPWNKLELRRRALELMRVDGVDTLLPKPPEPLTADPASENTAIMRGQLVKAVIEQDHMAHVKVHLMFIMQPLIAQGPGMTGPALAKIMDHVHEHLLLDYDHAVRAATFMMMQQMPDASPDQVAEAAAMKAQEATSQFAQQLIPLLNEAMQVVQSKTPPPPEDPGVAATKEVAMAQIQQKDQSDKANQALAQQRHQDEMMLKQKEFGIQPMLEAMQREFEAKLEVERWQREEDRNRFDKMIELQKNEADNHQHQMTELLKNRDDNETAIQTKLLELQAQVQNAPAPEAPDFTPMLKEMQTMLGQIEKAKTNDALVTVVDGLRATMEQLGRPKMIIKDANGKPIGIQ
jgi:hypothetical protein